MTTHDHAGEDVPKDDGSATVARYARSPLYPFQPAGWIVLVALALVGQAPFGAWVVWAVAVLWFLLIVRASESGSDRFPSVAEIRATPDLAALWGRGFMATLVIFFPLLLAVATGLARRYDRDQPFWSSATGPITMIGILWMVFSVWFYPAALSLAATDPDVLFLLMPRKISSRMRRTWPALAASFVGVFAVLVVAGFLDGLPPAVAKSADRALFLWLAFVVARLAGLSLVWKQTPTAP